jgi:hypothetical protein
MKVLGNAPDGDLIIQVSQTEWDSLQDGVRPKDEWMEKARIWPKTEAAKFLSTLTGSYGANSIKNAFRRNEIDGSIQSLRDIADGKIKISYVGSGIRTKLKELLDA